VAAGELALAAPLAVALPEGDAVALALLVV
jgi:hypothetical protein